MNEYVVFKPDQKYFANLAEVIVRLSKVDRQQVARVEINCGGAGHGAVILKDGSRVRV